MDTASNDAGKEMAMKDIKMKMDMTEMDEGNIIISPRQRQLRLKINTTFYQSHNLILNHQSSL